MAKRKLIDCEEAGKELGLKARTIRNMIRDGKLPAYRVGWAYRIDSESLSRWLEEQAVVSEDR